MKKLARRGCGLTPWIVLGVILLVSLVSNIVLYRQGQEYYLLLNETRLDPLGLAAFPREQTRASVGDGKPLVVFLGDSRAAVWPAPTQLDSFTFINRGASAQTTAQVLGRFPYHVQSLQPDILVLEVGINDLKTIPLFPDRKAAIVAECEANIRQLVQLATRDNTRVILVTIFPLGQIPIERRPFWSDDVALAIIEVNQFITTLAGDRVEIFDAAEILSNERGIVDSRYSKDFLHLNPTGYDALNGELVRVLQRGEGS